MPGGASPGEERIFTAELIGALSLATDLAMWFDFEHGLRSTLVAARLAERLGVDRETAAQTYHACLLQQVGVTADLHMRAEILGDMRAAVKNRELALAQAVLLVERDQQDRYESSDRHVSVPGA